MCAGGSRHYIENICLIYLQQICTFAVTGIYTAFRFHLHNVLSSNARSSHTMCTQKSSNRNPLSCTLERVQIANGKVFCYVNKVSTFLIFSLTLKRNSEQKTLQEKTVIAKFFLTKAKNEGVSAKNQFKKGRNNENSDNGLHFAAQQK